MQAERRVLRVAERSLDRYQVAPRCRRANVLSLRRTRPPRASHAATRTDEARGAEAPGQRTAACRLLRRVSPLFPHLSEPLLHGACKARYRCLKLCYVSNGYEADKFRFD